MFDSDKIGKDKSLGTVEISPLDLDSSEPRWFPLQGVKSGEILLNTEFLADGQAPVEAIGPIEDIEYGPEDDSIKSGHLIDKKPSYSGKPSGKKSGNLGEHDGPVLHIDLIKAKDLIKTDIIGKSDPYAVLKYRNQKDKTNVVKNSQNPQWNHSTDFDLDEENDSVLM